MWSVVQTESQRESVAAEFLKQAEFEIYLPRVALKGDRAAPLFPSYLFVQIIDRWYAVRWTVGVLRLLMNDDRPAAVPDKIVLAIQRREGRDGLIRLPRLRGTQRGDPMRVVHGSFAGQLALFDGMNGPDRVRVLIEALGRKVPVSLARGDVVATTEIARMSA